MLGDFNVGVSRPAEVDDVIGMLVRTHVMLYSSNRLVSFLNEVGMVVCNGRSLCWSLSGRELGLA